MEKQQTVEIIGFRASGYKAIQAVVLKPDLLSEKLVRVVGDIGNGKSSLMELLQIALSGSEAVAKKDALKSGFLSEVQISDGDHKLFMGARVTEYAKGENKGQAKFETFLFEKDMDGKPFAPVIDGRKATASDYMNMLHTDITFNIPALFSNNPTEHRKLLETLFSDELSKLGIEKVLEAIAQAKKRQDNTRAICEANGAFKTIFEEEGWKTEQLESLSKVDIEAIRQKITAKEIEKDRILNSAAATKELNETKARNERDEKLRAIQVKAAAVVEKIRELNEEKTSAYQIELDCFNKYNATIDALAEKFRAAESLIDGFPVDDVSKSAIAVILKEQYTKQVSAFGVTPLTPAAPLCIPIQSGQVQIPTEYDLEYAPLVQERQQLVDQYKAIQAMPIEVLETETPNTDAIDEAIASLKVQRDAADKNNQLVARFQYWTQWIEAKGIYEKEIDTLRKLYAKVNTGVPGLVITPITTKSERIEIYLQYNGQYDPAFFGNEPCEHRFLFDYSAFQRSIIGLMLQAARLDLKPKALRIAFIDDISVTRKSIEMLERVCTENDLRLWTSYAKDDYDLQNLADGEIVVQGGEIFFN
jgi:hypothetical protein